MSKKQQRRAIEELEQRLHIANKSQNFNDQSEIQLELGELLREEDPKLGIRHYENSLKSSKRAQNFRNIILSYRNLGELHIDLAETEDEYRKGFKYLKQQLEQAQECKDHGLVQLAFHTLAQSYVSEAQNFDCESVNLARALFYAQACFDYLNKYKREIDEDKKAIKTDEDSGRRCAGINSVLADIYIKFGATKKAMNHISASVDYALRNSNKTEPLFLYQCYFVKMELLRETACLELIENMRIYANKHKIKENREFLDRKYYIYLITCYPNDSLKLCEVIEYYLKQNENRNNPDFNYAENVLKYLYVLVNYQKRLAATVTDSDRSHFFEELGDKACNAEFFELGLYYYQKMVFHAEKSEDKERIYLACTSIVETTRNLHDYKEAIRYQEQALRLVRMLYPDDKEKIFIEECDLFYLNVRKGYNETVNKEDQYQRFLAILQQCDTNCKKAVVLDEFVLFLAFYGNKGELKRWSEELATANRLKDDELPVSTHEEKEQTELNSDERYRLREFVRFIRDKKEREDVSWKNNKGESRLHEAAKIDDANEVRRLIQSGQNVNAKDYAGWTPLMEAVNYGHLGNVRVLCQNGADVNAASSEGLIDDDGKVGPSGITPLMDACATGKIQIARVLMRLGSNVNLRNEHGETAADLLRIYIDSNRRTFTDKEMLACEALLTDLEKKTTKKRPPEFSTPNREQNTEQENVKRFCFDSKCDI